MSFKVELKSTHYDEALQLRKQGLSYRAISAKTGVSKTQLHRWLRIFAEKKPLPMRRKVKARRAAGVRPPERTGTKAPSVETLEQKVKRLEKELGEARLRADFYDEMINVAESKFGIQIRKKAGAKR